jgi:hypothetical protein
MSIPHAAARHLIVSLIAAAVAFRAAAAAIAPDTTAIVNTAGAVALHWTGRSGQFYRIESSPDLLTWTPVPGEYKGTGAALNPQVRAAGAATEPRMFWRVVAADRSFFTLAYPQLFAPVTGTAIVPLAAGVTFPDSRSPISFTITAGSLPDGFSLDPATGAITGTPTTAGSFTATIRATNGTLSADTVVNLLVTPPPPTLVDLGIADYSAGAKGPFARNPWDMTYFAGRIYVGQGNSDNQDSPDTNAGPMKIVSFVPGRAGFRYEGYDTSATLPEEQIDVIRVIDNALYIPGHDPRLDWTIRTIYKRSADSETWTQLRSTNAATTDSWGVHCYDIIGFDGKLFTSGYAYGISTDAGLTWTDAGLSFRGTAFLAVAGKLYCATCDSLWIYEYDPATRQFADRNDLSVQYWARFVPGIQGPDPFNGGAKIVRAITIGSRALYLGGYEASDHQVRTTDVYLARSLAKGAYDVVRTTPAGEAPWDLLARGSTAYLLTSRKTTATGADERFVVTIWQSTADLTGWTFFWSSPELATFARSFEEVDGDFYLGLGTDDGSTSAGAWDQTYTTGVKADSGRILWLRR